MNQNIRRYPGLNYFTIEQKEQFFGRDDEKEALLALVQTEKIVTLFGKSGYGKSSLLRAGLIPELGKNVLPILVQLGAYQAGQTLSPIDRTLVQLDVVLPADSPEMTFLENLNETENLYPEMLNVPSLWHHFKRKQRAKKSEFLLIFDQFEEFDSYPTEQREAFKQQLAELLFTRIPQTVRDLSDELSKEQQALLARPNEVKALFAIREDRLSVLDLLADKLPIILNKRFHLKGLDDQQARESIEKPASLPQGERYESPAFTYSPAAVTAIKKGLKKNEKDDTIESFLLQICCEEIERKVISYPQTGGKIVIIEENLPVFKDLFEQYYRNKIAALPDESTRKAARYMIEEHLVKTDAKSGISYRINVDGRTLCTLPNVNETLLKRLTDVFLLRSEPNTTEGFSYEVSHDRLLEGILVAKSERLKEAKEALEMNVSRQVEQGKADAAKRNAWKKAEEEKRQRRYQRRLLITSCLIFAAVVAMVFAFKKTKQAESLLEAAKLLAVHKLPKNFDALIPLDSLNCFHWELEFISPKIKKLQNLKSLDLSSNYLSSLPPEIGELQNLQSLFLGYNYLSSLPPEIGNLQNLRVLVLPGNRLHSLPVEIGKLQRLGWLDLRGNKFSSLPIEIFKKMPNLKTIILQDKKFNSTIPESTIAELQAAIPWCKVKYNE